MSGPHGFTTAPSLTLTGQWYQHTLNYVSGTSYDYEFSGSHPAARGIKYNATTRKWEDNGSMAPYSLTPVGSVSTETSANPGSVTGYDYSGTAIWTFTNPYYDPNFGSGPTVTSINRLTPWTTTVDDGVNPPVSYHLEGEIVTNDAVTSSDVTLAKDFASYPNSNLTLRLVSAGNYFGIAKPSDGLYHIAVGDKHNDYLYNDDSWRSSLTSSSSTRTTNATRILNVLATIPFNAKIYVRTRKNFGSWSEWEALGTSATRTRTREEHRLLYSSTNTTSSGYTNYGFNSDSRVSFKLGTMQDSNGDDQIGGQFILHKWRQDDHNNGWTHTGTQHELGAQSSIYSAAISNDSSVLPYDKYFQKLVTDTWQYQYRIDDWLFHNEPEGDGDVSTQTCDHDYSNCRHRRAHSFW